eukprot:516924_1
MAQEQSSYCNSLSPEKYFLIPNNNDSNNNLSLGDSREIGDEALSWELSSAKSGHGVFQLRDDNLTTFWQSDGMVPHTVKILFHKKQLISSIGIYIDYKLDESYTPQNIIIKASSSSLHNYENNIVCKKILHEPNGWIILKLNKHKRQNKFDKYCKTNKIIMEIQSSHQSGRDTHIRQIKIYAPSSIENNNNNNNNYIFEKQNKHQESLSDDDDDDDDDDDENYNGKKK